MDKSTPPPFFRSQVYNSSTYPYTLLLETRACWIWAWYCRKMLLFQKVSLWNVFPPRYSTINCKCYRCKVEAFRNHSNTTMKQQTMFSAGAGSLSAVPLSDPAHQHYDDSLTAESQTSSSLNISTKTLCRELNGMGFHGWADPVGVICRWPSTFIHIV